MYWKDVYEAKGTRSQKWFPKKKGKKLFVNVNALVDEMALRKHLAGKEAMLNVLNTVTYDDRRTPLTKELKDKIIDKVDTIDIKDPQIKNAVPTGKQTYTGTPEPRAPEAEESMFWSYGDLMSQMGSTLFTDFKSYIKSYTFGNGNHVYDSLRAGGHQVEGKRPVRFGDKVFMKEFTQAFDIRVDDLISYRFIRDYEADIFETQAIQRKEDMNAAFTKGVDKGASYEAGDPPTAIMNGLQYKLQNYTGTFTDPNTEETIDAKFFKNQFMPGRFGINDYLGKSLGSIHEATGAEIYSVMEQMSQHPLLNKFWSANLSSMMAGEFYLPTDVYTKVRSYIADTLYVENESARMRQGNNVPMQVNGININLLQNLEEIIIYGRLDTCHQVASSSPERSNSTVEYKPRLSSGGRGYEYTNYLYSNLFIDNPMFFYIARINDEAIKPEIYDSDNWYDAENINGTSGTTKEVYVSNPNKMGKMYYTIGASASTPTTSDNEVTEMEKLTLTSGDVLTVKIISQYNADSAEVTYTVS